MSTPAVVMAVLAVPVLIATVVTWFVRDLPRIRRGEADR